MEYFLAGLRKPRLNKPLLILCKMVVYTTIFYAIEQLFALFSGVSAVPAFIVTMLIIVYNQGKLTRLLQGVIDRQFFFTLYRIKLLAKSFSSEMDSILEYGQMLQKTRRFLTSVFGDQHYALYIRRVQDFEYVAGPELLPQNQSFFR